MSDPREHVPEHLRYDTPDGRSAFGCGAFLLVFGAIATVHFALRMPIELAVIHLPTAGIAAWVISKNAKGLGARSKQWLAAAAVAVVIALSFGLARPVLDHQHYQIQKTSNQIGSDLIFPCSKKCTEWLQGEDAWPLVGLFGFPFALMFDLLLLPVGVIEVLAGVMEVLPLTSQLFGLGLVLSLPGLVGLYAVRRLVERPA